MPPDSTEQERRDATNEEIETLRHVVDTIPRNVWVALAIGACERFTFYAVSAPWQNYLQNSPGLAVPGELGLGQATATNIYNAYYFFSFLTPLLFAILSDAWLGRFKTLFFSSFVYVCGCIILFVTSFSDLTTRETKIGGLACALLLIGFGTGGVKATISPFIGRRELDSWIMRPIGTSLLILLAGDQYPSLVPQLITLKSGEKVIADRTLTIQYIYNVFYWLTNIASLSLIPSTYLEKLKGFWSAYLLSLCSFWTGVFFMVVWRNEFGMLRCKVFWLLANGAQVKIPPNGNVLPKAGKALFYAARSGFNLDAAKADAQLEKHGRVVPWNDHFIAELKRGLIACRRNIPFGPIARMVTAFVTMAMAMAITAGIQKWIYNSGPCYELPLECPASGGGKIPNQISVWAQTPIYFFLAMAEIFGFATLSEYSYSKAPKDMRSLVQALRQVTAGVGSAFGMALSPVGVNPKILYMYISLAVMMAICAPIFWLVFAKYDAVDKELDDLDRLGETGDDDGLNPTPIAAIHPVTKEELHEVEGNNK
ncbi:oligopeptide transporter protein [Rutstroemia sp. NJR-2017a WRK4]|nr:oligopeptide transporter protein [Rutstroemia sp. NJR-2017a WRK4]